MAHHELWRDEGQAWLLARDSSSAIDLLSRQKFEDHPALWQLLLMPLTRAFGTPIAMQVLNLLIATTTVYLFVRWSPFTRLRKVLLIFGCFPFLFVFGAGTAGLLTDNQMKALGPFGETVVPDESGHLYLLD